MERDHEGEALDVPDIVVDGGDANANAAANSTTESPASSGTNGEHLVDAHDFKNMRLAIGTLDRNILEISLSDNLAAGGTRHIDIRLRQNNRSPAPASSGGGVVQVAQAVEPAGNQAQDEQQQAAPSSSRLKITVAADDPDPDADDREYLIQMRGWLMTVSTLFVGITFQAAIQPPDWVQRALNDSDNGSADDAAAPSPQAENQGATATTRMLLYVLANTSTFASALGMVPMLLHARNQETSSAKLTMKVVKCTVSLYSLGLALTLATAISSSSWYSVVPESIAIAGISALIILIIFTLVAIL